MNDDSGLEIGTNRNGDNTWEFIEYKFQNDVDRKYMHNIMFFFYI